MYKEDEIDYNSKPVAISTQALAYQGGGLISGARVSAQTEALDSGHRTNFDSGAQRDRAPGKGRYVLLSPIGLKRIALRCEAGEIKYGDGRNWEKGMPISEFIDSSIRHIMQYMEGDTSEDHLAAAAWNLQAAMHIEEKMPEMQDIPSRPEYRRKPKLRRKENAE